MRRDHEGGGDLERGAFAALDADDAPVLDDAAGLRHGRAEHLGELGKGQPLGNELLEVSHISHGTSVRGSGHGARPRRSRSVRTTPTTTMRRLTGSTSQDA
ncbi:hypothetical protein D3C74_415460 [compost metagenome]